MSHTATKRLSQGPVVLLIWDGFGTSPKIAGNATVEAKMPTWHKLLESYPHTTLEADGEAAGLPHGQTGNSEAGHVTIGAGRPVETDQVRIDTSIVDKSFYNNPALLRASAHCAWNNSVLHLMGLLTAEQSGHASFGHICALLKFVEKIKRPRVALHLFTDGRDTPPFRAAQLIAEIEKVMPKNVSIASISGRFYAMDRNRNWDRTLLAYEAMVDGKGLVSESPIQAVTQAYARGETDEYITPTVICQNNTCIAPVSDRDAVVFWNLRSDRARQMIKPFIAHEPSMHSMGSMVRHTFRRGLCFVTLAEFGKGLDNIIPSFPHREVNGTLIEALRGNRQVYAAESEKFSQVTYFMNGGYDEPRFGERRIRIPSRRVTRADVHPEMRARELARRLVSEVGQDVDFICANFANADIAGHSGNENAAIKACEALDDALAVVWEAVRSVDGTLIVTADHGNAECMRDPHGGPDTGHNPSPVPFLVAGKAVSSCRVRRGTLADVAPTVLSLLGVDKPKEMTGKNLLQYAST